MEIVGALIALPGAVACMVGGIWLLILGFKKHILWGLGMLFVPFVGIVFVIKYWDEAKKPFLINLGGVGLAIVGGFVAGAMSHPH